MNTKEKRDILSLSLSPDAKETLERLALEFGAKWGEKPNISELLRMICQGEIVLVKKEEMDNQRAELKEIATKLIKLI